MSVLKKHLGAGVRGRLSWVFIGLLAALCAFLGIIQNRWLSELARAERERMKNELQAQLTHLGRDFNTEIAASYRALAPSASEIEQRGKQQAYAARYSSWRETHGPLFRRIALAIPDGSNVLLQQLDLNTAKFKDADWPESWLDMRSELLGHLRHTGFHVRPTRSTLIEIPRFGSSLETPGEQEWLVLELNVDYVVHSLIPELLQKYIADGRRLEYEAEVVAADDPSQVIFRSPVNSRDLTTTADASIGLLTIDGSSFGRPRRPEGPRREPPDGRGPMFGNRPPPGGGWYGAPPRPERAMGMPGPPPSPARWRLMVRHRAGSLEAAVAKARWQNVALSGAVLLMILATAAMLVRFSRRAEELGQMQLNFVAGVSHELRTPLTVIRTAAFNLCGGKTVTTPEHVEKYARLIQDQSQKLGALIDQVLTFASSSASNVIRRRDPISVSELVEGAINSVVPPGTDSGLVIEKYFDPDLPLVSVDPLAMQQVLKNLLENAVKYATEDQKWIGLTAFSVADRGGGAMVEIRVADRGPGIDEEDQPHIFQPFYRGRRALRDQVHGTGLGLNLAKKIVEAHGGTLSMNSEPGQGCEFIIRIPAIASLEVNHGLAHSTG